MRSPLSALLLLSVCFGSGARATEKRCDELRKTKNYRVLFDRVELDKLVQVVSDATCRTFILSDALKAKVISIIGPANGRGELDADHFYIAFLGALDVNGLTVVESEGFSRIVPKAQARQGDSPVDPATGVGPGMVTRIVRLKNVEAETLKATLTGFLSPGGELVVAAPDLLLITDLASNGERLAGLLDALDTRAPNETLHALPLRHASVTQVADKVQKLLEGRPGTKNTAQVLADERTNQLLLLSGPQAFERVAALLEVLDVPVADGGQVHVYRLEHSDAKDLAASLQVLVQGGGGPKGTPGGSTAFSGDVKISENAVTNSLLIVANESDYRGLSKVIAELDTPRRQVFIETVIMEVNVTRSHEVGVDFHGFGGTPSTSGGLGTSLEDGSLGPPSLSLTSLASVAGLFAGIQGPSILLPALQSVLGNSVSQFGLVLHALQQSSDVNVLSTPHILAVDNEEAEIAVGQKVSYQTSLTGSALNTLATSNPTAAALSASIPPQVTRVPIELKLKVKPHISGEDHVRLDVDQSSEELAPGSSGLARDTSTRSQKTTVVLADRQTVVLGGIMQDRLTESVKKVPVLGDLPLLGALFRSSSQEKHKTNLVVLITPHIIHSSADFQALRARKLAERRALAEQFYGEVPDDDVILDIEHQAGPLMRMLATLQREERMPEHGGPGEPDEHVVRPEASPPPRAL